MEVPMLDEQEYARALELYGSAFKSELHAKPISTRIKPLLDYYNELTGWFETQPNAIMHHRIALYGPPCENCHKPYRTDKANFCAACGHKRTIDS